ncbi:MAG: sigma-70 family RNA polymerase sigma factor [Hydrogenophilaceae bacterium]|nr:sigma-70 family RNA polymerase sigma factor [Hydrogenophilaceae bacterium]
MSTGHQLEPGLWLERYGTYLFRYALATLRDERLAEDAVQDCLLAAWQAQSTYSGQASERTWLTGILKHKIVDIVRKDSREKPLEKIEPDNPYGEFEAGFDETGHWANLLAEWGDPAAAFENKFFWQVLEACLSAMPRRLAQLFMLREVVGADSEKVCQELEITPTNLWTMLYRSRMSLRRCLEQNWAGVERA